MKASLKEDILQLLSLLGSWIFSFCSILFLLAVFSCYSVFFAPFAVCRNKISDFFHTISHRWTLNKYNIIRKNHAIRNFDREICRFYRAWCTLSSGMPSTGTFICLCFDCVHINLVHSHALVCRSCICDEIYISMWCRFTFGLISCKRHCFSSSKGFQSLNSLSLKSFLPPK